MTMSESGSYEYLYSSTVESVKVVVIIFFKASRSDSMLDPLVRTVAVYPDKVTTPSSTM